MHLTVYYYHVTYGFQSESIFFSLPEYQGILYLKQVPYLKFKLQQRHSHPKPPKTETNTQPFTETRQLIELCVNTYLYGTFDCMLLSCHVRVSEWIWNTHSIVCLTINKLLCRSRRNIWSLSDSNKIETHDYLVRKRTRNYLAKLTKWLSCVVRTELSSGYDCMLLSYHRQVSEWIHTL